MKNVGSKQSSRAPSNDAAHEPGTQPATISSGKGGKMPAAKELQILLQQAVKQE